MQESRLFKILYHLVNEGSSTAPQLAEKFEVSVRTIYRDIDVISSAGIPIYATQGSGGGIFIAEDFVLDKSLLSQEEKEQVLMALQGIIATSGEHQSELLSKLASLFQLQSSNWIEVDFTNWKKGRLDQVVFTQLKDAIFHRFLVLFQYYGGKGSVTSRKVAPLKLIFKDKDWYLYGYCYLRNDARFFKVSRMKKLEVISEEYPSAYLTFEPVREKAIEETTISVSLKFHKSVAYRVYDEFQEAVIKDEKGNLYVHADLPDNEMLYSYIFSFGNDVEVLEPSDIRKQVEEKLLKMYEIYRT